MTTSATPQPQAGGEAAPGRWRRPLLAVATVAYIAGATLLLVAPADPANRIALVQTFALFACGALIVQRTSTQVIGWLLIVPGVTFNVLYATDLATGARATGWTQLLSPLSQLGILSLMLLIVLFPSGRLETGIARIAATIGVTGQLLALALEVAFNAGVDGTSYEQAFTVMTVTLIPVVVLGLVDHARRYRARPRVEQLQLKWFLVAMAGQFAFPAMLVAGVEPGSTAFAVGDNLATTLFPVTILVAITRYRLYEIDRIVSRTVAYALVIGTLALLFVGGISLATTLLPARDNLAVAATTVVVAALFNPLRHRVVAAVDRRFNRSRYVAEQVIEQFGRAIQDRTDLDDVRLRVHGVIGDTVAPRTVAVWTRDT